MGMCKPARSAYYFVGRFKLGLVRKVCEKELNHAKKQKTNPLDYLRDGDIDTNLYVSLR
jgi:hypothetical protein